MKNTKTLKILLAVSAVIMILLLVWWQDVSAGLPPPRPSETPVPTNPYPPPAPTIRYSTNIPTPFATTTPQPINNGVNWAPLTLYEYPWAYGTFKGLLLNEIDHHPISGVCVAAMKIWCDDDNGMPEGCYFVFAEDASPRARTNQGGYFEFDTTVWYATKQNGNQPYDGGTGYFSLIALETCSAFYGYYDIQEGGPYSAKVYRLYPEQVLDIGIFETWFAEPIGLENVTLAQANRYLWGSLDPAQSSIVRSSVRPIPISE